MRKGFSRIPYVVDGAKPLPAYAAAAGVGPRTTSWTHTMGLKAWPDEPQPACRRTRRVAAEAHGTGPAHAPGPSHGC